MAANNFIEKENGQSWGGLSILEKVFCYFGVVAKNYNVLGVTNVIIRKTFLKCAQR